MKARVRRMLEVKSDMIHKVGFDSTTPGVSQGYLVVQFASNLKAYGYQNVAWSDYLQMINAPSIGAAFNLLIKDKYPGDLLTVEDGHAVVPTELSKAQTWEVGKVGAISNYASTPDDFSQSSGVPLFDVMEDVPKSKPKHRK